MKMPKLSFGDEGVKGFFFRHVEKFIVSLVLLMVLWLLYSGFSGYSKSALNENAPNTVMEAANGMTRHIDDPNSWKVVQERKQLMPTEFARRANEQSRPIEKLAYAVRVPWNPPLLPAKTKRTDPKVLKAIKTEAVAGYGAIAMLPSDDLPDILLDEAGQHRLKERREQMAKEDERRRKELEEQKLEAKRREADAKKAAALAARGGASRIEPKRPGSKAQQESDINKLLGHGGSGPSGEGSVHFAEVGHAEGPEGIEFHTSSPATPKGFYFVAVTALVPYKSQWKEYQYCFKDADGYEPLRDTPKYRRFLVERQEEGQDKWVALSNSKLLSQYQAFVSERPEEIADPRYVDAVLSLPLPPLLRTDLTKFALHSQVPQYVPGEEATPAEAAPAEEAKPAPKGAEDPWGGDGVIGLAPGAARPGAGPAPPHGVAGAASGRNGPPGNERPGSHAQAANANVEPDVEYKLFRFFDFNVEPGKKYRYRIKLGLDDPNNPRPTETASDSARPGAPRANPNPNPQDGSEKPPISTLAPEVLERLKDENAPKHLRVTDWSDESPFVSVPKTQHLFAGAVTPPTKSSSNFVAEPEAKVLLTVWDNRRAVNVPLESEVRRGSILDVTKDTDVVHPAVSETVKLKDYPFRTGTVVIDIRGGEPLPNADKKNPGAMTSSGEVLMLTGSGELVARDEMADFREYQRIRPESEQPKPSAGAAGPAGGGFNPVDILGPPAGRPAPIPVRPQPRPR